MPEQHVRIQVTATDLDTSESDTVIITDDYVLTCAGSCYVHHVQAYANGTHVITVKGRGQGRRDAGETSGIPS
jgi:hypothetical protein